MSDLKVTDRRWWARTEESPDQPGQNPDQNNEVPRLKPTYIEELEARIASKDAELQELLVKYRSAADEFDQARTRLRKEIAKDVERGRRSVVVSFLDILDNLDRALAAACDRPDDPLVQGISLVQQQFLTTLDAMGVARINPLGDMFDPTRHEAVARTPAHGLPEGQIVGVVRPGYLIGDEVIRPAMVAVAGAGT